MSKNIEKQYLKLLKDILDNGVEKETRNGNTISVFGRQIRHDMSKGFPLLTTKKMAFKTMVTELLWFLKGDTNIKYLVDNDCHIWDGDAYKNYREHILKQRELQKKRVQELRKQGKKLKVAKIELLSKEEFINKIKTDDEFAKKWGELGPIYGKQWRRWKGKLIDKSKELDAHTAWVPEQIDQIANLISELKTNPDSRRLMVSAWNVGELDQMVLPPCHYGFQVYTRELSWEERRDIAEATMDKREFSGYFNEEKGYWVGFGYISPFTDWAIHAWLNSKNIPRRAISLMWNQRSVDTFLGLPFNIASYGLLLEIIAKAVNMVPDELIGNLGDVHLYSNHIEQAREQLTREPYSLPKININTEWWPTESGECGEGPLDAMAVLNGFSNDDFCKCLLEEDIQLGNYQSHPTIKAPLSN